VLHVSVVEEETETSSMAQTRATRTLDASHLPQEQPNSSSGETTPFVDDTRLKTEPLFLSSAEVKRVRGSIVRVETRQGLYSITRRKRKQRERQDGKLVLVKTRKEEP
jgi:ribosomal protein L34